MSSSVSVAACDDLNEEEGFWEKISYTWVIENIDRCVKDTDNTLLSPIFYNNMRDSGWQIESNFPPKSVPSDKDYLGVFLRSVFMLNDTVEVKFTLSLQDSSDHEIETTSCERCFTKNYSWGYPEMVSLSQLRSSTRDKTFKIHTDFLIKVIHFGLKGEDLTMGSCFSEARLRKSMNVLFESSQFTDVVFEVEEVELKAHKCVLSARSPVFAAMFTQDGDEKNSNVVKIVDFESDIFRRFLHFVYSGKASIPSIDVAAAVFRAAEKYDFPDLKRICVKYMSTNLNSLNVGSVLLLAETFRVKDLKQTAMNYVVENITNFCDVEMEVYQLLEKENPKLLTELFVMSSKNLLKKISSYLVDKK